MIHGTKSKWFTYGLFNYTLFCHNNINKKFKLIIMVIRHGFKLLKVSNLIVIIYENEIN